MSNALYLFPLVALASVVTGASFAAGCGGSSGASPDGGLTTSTGGQIFGQPPPATDGGGTALLPRCIASTKQCVASCSAGASTNVTGTVYDPAGRNPLYGIVVYVPSVPPGPLPAGSGCYSCASLYQSGMPIAYAVSDSAGKFTLTGVPDGANIPLVVQVGKWRMQYTLPNVTKCANNDAAPAAAKVAAPTVLRLPRNQMEGDLPSIAIATGAADSLECLLSRIGVDKAEYGAGNAGPGRIHIFQGDGGANTVPPAPVAARALWPDDAAMTKAAFTPYDITLLTCESHETTSLGGGLVTTAEQQGLFDYAAAGGRVFASHFHYQWFINGPFAAQNLATWMAGRQAYQVDPNTNIQTTLPNGKPFPRGVAMKEWLTNVGALTNGELPLVQARHNAVVGTANVASIPWIVSDMMAELPNQTEYFSFDTPFGVAPVEQCGRVVYSDLHVGGASMDYGETAMMDHIPPNSVVPSGCADNPLSPQEKALEFMLFDLSGCITPPDQGAGGVPMPIK